MFFNRTIKSALLIGAIFSLVGCDNSPSYDEELVKLVSKQRIGRSPNYWLYKHTGSGLTGFSRVALIYGFAYNADRGGLTDRNKIFCEDIITLYTKMYPNTVYKCDVAN